MEHRDGGEQGGAKQMRKAETAIWWAIAVLLCVAVLGYLTEPPQRRAEINHSFTSFIKNVQQVEKNAELSPHE